MSRHKEEKTTEPETAVPPVEPAEEALVPEAAEPHTEAAKAAARARRPGARGSFLEEWRERTASAWLIAVHLAVLLGLVLFPAVRIGYERLANAPLKPLVSWGGLGLMAFSIVVAWIVIELLVYGLNLLNVVDIAGREYALYYVSPIAYVLGTAFLFIMGFVFYLEYQYLVRQSPFGGQPPSLQSVFSFMGTVLLFILPLWTMRLLAEEQRQGTIELLLTSPVRDSEVVLGKYIAALSLYLDVLALTLVYPIILFSLGNPDPGPVLGGYLGVLLFGGALLAVGVLASSVTENQVIAAVLSFAVYLGFLLIAAASSFGDLLPVKELQELLGRLNIFEHLDSFMRGLVSSYSLVFFASIAAISLFLATRVLEMRRWR